MELVRNKASGKIFVVLDDDGANDFLVVTPDGKVKRLERRLFTYLKDIDQASEVERLVTKAQLTGYKDYFGEQLIN